MTKDQDKVYAYLAARIRQRQQTKVVGCILLVISIIYMIVKH